MRPIELLTVGNSLRETKDHPHRYKLTERNLLPKFGAKQGAPAPQMTVEEQTKKNMKTEMAEVAPPVPARSSVYGARGKWIALEGPPASRGDTVTNSP